MKTLAEIEMELEALAEEELCHECHSPLTDSEREQGYLCATCICDWADEAMNVMEA